MTDAAERARAAAHAEWQRMTLMERLAFRRRHGHSARRPCGGYSHPRRAR